VTADSSDSNGIRVEGFLSKYSSGQFSRWQKRFFVLDGGRLSYYKKIPSDSTAHPNKSFGIRRIRQVQASNTPDDCDFTLVFTNDKAYSIRAQSFEDMKKWVSAIRAAIEYAASEGGPGAGNPDGDDNMSDNDGMTSMNGSIFSDASPKSVRGDDSSPVAGGVKITSMLQGLIIPKKDTPAPPPTIPETPWTVDIDQLNLDKNFEEWFYFVPTDTSTGESPTSGRHHNRRSSSTASVTTIAREIRMTHVIDGCNRAGNHMWSVLAGLPRGNDIRLEDAIAKAKQRIHGQNAIAHAQELVEEYVLRIVKYVGKCLDCRAAAGSVAVPTASEIPSLMECICKFIVGVDRLLFVQGTDKCVCCYCDPSGVGMTKFFNSAKKTASTSNGSHHHYLPSLGGLLGHHSSASSGVSPAVTPVAPVLPPVSCSGDKWRKSFRSLLQRLGGELEVGLIEELQGVIMSAEFVWDMPPGTSSQSVAAVVSSVPGGHRQSYSDVFRGQHGPSPQSHPLLDELKPIRNLAVMSSFSPSFVQTAQSKCINASQQWMAAYPQSARLISEHSSSALVASMNSVFRQFKRRCMVANEAANHELAKRYTESIRHSRETAIKMLIADHAQIGQFVQSVASVGSAPGKSSGRAGSDSQPIISHQHASDHHDQIPSLENLISFANECVLISRFCSRTWSNGVTSKFTPEVFLTCMEGLSTAFLSSATDVCQTLIKIHFIPSLRYDLLKLFCQKVLSKNTSSPMDACTEYIKQFFVAVDSLSPLPCVREGIGYVSAQGVVRSYLPALIKNKPKLKTFKTLPELIEHDIATYTDWFRVEMHVPQEALVANTVLASEVVKMLNDKNPFNFTIHFNTASKMTGSMHAAYHLVRGVLKMKEHELNSSREKKDVTNMLNSMKQTATKNGPDDSEYYPESDDVSTTVDGGSSSSDAHVSKKQSKAVAIHLNVGQIKYPWKFDE